MSEPLTQWSHCGGCAAKLNPASLTKLLSSFANWVMPADLIVGLKSLDDAAIYKLNETQAIVQTVDFFPPLVDTPYDFGAIAAANAMSDVYAMGGEVLFALNIAAFPEELPQNVVAEIFRGAAEKVAEAEGAIVGGHTIQSHSPIYGLCVTGIVHPQRILANGGAKPGDILYLTKPLGTGIVITANKLGVAEDEYLKAAIAWMTRLNRKASQLVQEVGANALTDITGFGLLGHAYEMAKASGVNLHILTNSLPVLPGAADYAQNISTSNDASNRQYLADRVVMQADVPKEIQTLLYDPQTSGGLLIAVSSDKASVLESQCAAEGEPLWRVGTAISGEGLIRVSRE